MKKALPNAFQKYEAERLFLKRRRCLVIISAVTAVRRNSYQKYRICLSSTKRGGSRSRPAPFYKCCRSLQALPCGDRAGCIVHAGARCTRRGTVCSLALPSCAVCSYTRTIGHGASVSSCTARLYHRARRVCIIGRSAFKCPARSAARCYSL